MATIIHQHTTNDRALDEETFLKRDGMLEHFRDLFNEKCSSHLMRQEQGDPGFQSGFLSSGGGNGK